MSLPPPTPSPLSSPLSSPIPNLCTPAPATDLTPNTTAKSKKRKATTDNTSKPSSSKRAKSTSTAKTSASRQRNKKKGVKQTRALPIGRSYDECEAHDKMIVDWRDAGESWEKVRKEWTRMTGEKNVGHSTLPNRYMRLKSNFTHLPDTDRATLIAAKQEVEDAFEEEKWERIAERMMQKGTDAYVPGVLYIQYRKMMLGAEGLPAAREQAKRRGQSKWQSGIDEQIATWSEEEDGEEMEE